MKLWPIGALVLIAANSHAYAQDSGCGDCGGYSEGVIERLSEHFGVDTELTKWTLDELAEEKPEDLVIMRSTSERGCAGYAICDQIPNSFFLTLVEAAQSRQANVRQDKVDKENAQRDWWNRLFAFGGLIVGASGLGLSIHNIASAKKRENARQKKAP